MSLDLQELEAKLSVLRPAALDSGLLARLADTATNIPTALSPDATEMEALLSGYRPAAMPPALAAALAEVSAPLPPAVIPFPTAPRATADARQQRRPMLAAAAAVAILGATAALFVPRHDSPGATMAAIPRTTEARPLQSPPATTPILPAAFNTGLSQASDEGVVWQGNKSPQRVVKVVYWDRVTVVDPSGRKIEVEQPRIEYILVPEKID
jgi:hypothetical protein